jgi:tRNA threonylcarbamoyladenosine biosynthesis protein TsaE
MENVMIRYHVQEPDELDAVAKALVPFCGTSRVVAFFGPMGAGKTTLIRCLCHELGVEENVSSPTFSIINEYRLPGGGKVFHFDFYRLDKLADAAALGLEEYFESGEWCLVEWPEKILNLLPEQRVQVRIEHRDQGRSIEIEHG